MPKRAYVPPAEPGGRPTPDPDPEQARRPAAPAAPLLPVPGGQQANPPGGPVDTPARPLPRAEPARPLPWAVSAYPQHATNAAPTPPTGLPVTPAVLARPVPQYAPDGAGQRTAAELTDFTIVRQRSHVPSTGWRRAVYALSGGAINPGPSPHELRRLERIARVQRPLPGSHFVAVASLKGGVGKSTVAAMLGLVLADNRGDRVVSLDADPDAGTLADRLTGDVRRSVRDLLGDVDSIRALPDVARYASLVGRLQVVASAQDPELDGDLDRAGYEQVTSLLARYYNIVITDSGTGVLHSAMGATLERASSLVIVGSPTVDGAGRAGKTLDWLVAHGYQEAVERAVVVLSQDRTSREVDADRIRAHFTSRCRAVVEIPNDPHLAAGGRIVPGRLRPATADAFLELAALISDEFGSIPPRRRPAPQLTRT